jgi:hypothetical protein
MWESVTAVDSNHDPVIYEGSAQRVVTVLNAGPGTVELQVWDVTKPTPDTKMVARLELRPGNTRTTGGSLVRARAIATLGGPAYAAIAWRVST